MYRYVFGHQSLTPLKNFAAYYISQNSISRDSSNKTMIIASHSPSRYFYAYVDDTYETKLTTITDIVSRQSKLMVLNSGDGFVEPEIDSDLTSNILEAKISNTYSANIAESTVYLDIKNALDDLFNIVNHKAIGDEKKY